MNPNKTATQEVLAQISQVLEDHYTQQQDFPGLLSGRTGAALFFAYYYQYNGDQRYLDLAYELLVKSITDMSEEAMLLSHCSGISGICWAVQHFINQGFVEQEGMEDIFEDVNDMLGNHINEELERGQCDFLHQGLGATVYFLERPLDAISERYLTDAVRSLAAVAREFPEGITWKDHFSKTSMQLGGDGDCYNLGLSHGVPAILTILGLIYEKGVAREEARRLAEGGVRWLLATRNKEVPDNLSLYPVVVDEQLQPYHTSESRLGWCYGDLGIGITLLNVGKSLGHAEFIAEGTRILQYIVSHRDHQNGAISDACLCHGSAGVMHILRRAYLFTKDPLLLAGAERWLGDTLQLNNHADGAAGYKFYTSPAYEDNYSLLEGVSGIGLALIASLDDEHVPDWDRSLLIS